MKKDKFIELEKSLEKDLSDILSEFYDCLGEGWIFKGEKDMLVKNFILYLKKEKSKKKIYKAWYVNNIDAYFGKMDDEDWIEVSKWKYLALKAFGYIVKSENKIL